MNYHLNLGLFLLMFICLNGYNTQYWTKRSHEELRRMNEKLDALIEQQRK